jgi:hypothetical protein
VVLGKNGEIVQGLGISLAVRTKYLQKEIKADLVTDSNGKVTISNPNNVVFIEATVENKGDIIEKT